MGKLRLRGSKDLPKVTMRGLENPHLKPQTDPNLVPLASLPHSPGTERPLGPVVSRDMEAPGLPGQRFYPDPQQLSWPARRGERQPAPRAAWPPGARASALLTVHTPTACPQGLAASCCLGPAGWGHHVGHCSAPPSQRLCCVGFGDGAGSSHRPSSRPGLRPPLTAA